MYAETVFAASACEFAKEYHLAFDFAHRHVVVGHTGIGGFHIVQLVIVGGEKCLRVETAVGEDVFYYRPGYRYAVVGGVPPPSSSKSISERWLMLFRIDAASFISTMNVDSPPEMLSLAPTRVNILSTTPMRAESAATKQPIWAMMTLSAVWRRSADLPDMLGR